jgi:glycosyltransferase involved in cell wall biosynthesis
VALNKLDQLERHDKFDIELSILMPCLNEAETLGDCIKKARGSMAELGIAGEVIVADNGCSDGSREIAAGAGARVIEVAEKGYGSALLGGIRAAHGKYVIMGDADDSYDFSGADQGVANRVLAFHAPFFSALLGALIFVWTHAITRRFAWSFFCALGAAFTTMIWPYAYIGLETSQSLFLALAGFLAFRENVANRRLGALWLILACAVAVSVKSNGLFLWPAIIYATACYFLSPEKTWRDFRGAHILKTLLASAAILSVYLANNHVKMSYWVKAGAATFVTSEILVKDVTSYLLNVWSLFFSTNKSFTHQLTPTFTT